jgi:predicted alpha/beta-fold hydrolase
VQSVLATVKFRRLLLRSPRDGRAPCATSIETPEGVRLVALHERPPDGSARRGVAILLHGWEGSARSTYLESLRPGLLEDGWELYRLNLRDHGDTQHLNRELFHSCRIAEVVDAVAALAARHPGEAPVLVGFSLGGNFALRVALRAPERAIPLRGVVAVNPVLDPASCLDALERGPRMFERHFVAKWRRSIRRKEAAFPDLHDFSAWHRLDGLRDQTRYLIERLTEYPTLEAYLDGYSIAGDRLRPLRIPSTLISTRDDPIIPVGDVETLSASPDLRIELHDRGGHCGYVETPWLRTWIDDRIRDLLRQAPYS